VDAEWELSPHILWSEKNSMKKLLNTDQWN
jgi:hypothetical protein